MNKNALFEALAEPNRRKILDLILVRERSVSELVELMSLSQPGVSKHLRILREAGLVRLRKDAKHHMYGLNPAPLQEVYHWFEPYRQYWLDKLDALEKQLDEEE
ncbi:ArsR/SmtB family transcription factor [Paenibacillus arenilitoris]|uniref:Winged helix-turn-helix transcriptional regulator n=1 Tax=Paenibacillus arenilitoris TaxID=2772299 RepID=A0A927CLQ8_9BACL|nr:metalloregulator ArsR/SmtB family transcription factor [Paenibacillus arenilitoris]MBD2870359.1 winged helix-turn-helix transcriptional regulator [Paenibacillus arenilitoris]